MDTNPSAPMTTRTISAASQAAQLAGRIKHFAGCPYGRTEEARVMVDGEHPATVRRCVECGGQVIIRDDQQPAVEAA